MRVLIERKRPGLRLGYHHFAFFRGYLNGIGLEMLGDRYLETGTDLRAARRTLEWIRAELVAAAKRYRQSATSGASMARLLRIPPERLKAQDSARLEAVPTLEDFQAEYDPHGFYSEKELIEEFERRYAGRIGASVSSHGARNGRLLKRLLDTVGVLEAWIATTPKPADPISVWIEPVVVDRLAEAGIVSIEDLVGLINRKGRYWYRRLPGFGAVRAQRILRWLEINQVLPVADWALQSSREGSASLAARCAPSSGIVPLERLQPGVDLDGSLGTNRCPRAQIQAHNDLEAVRAWLDIKGGNKHTRRAYIAQAERFVLWLVHEKRRPLSSAGPEDCNEYGAFLAALDAPGCPWPWRLPRSAWVGEKGVARWHPDWKPFAGKLSPASCRQAVLILKGLFAFLTKVRYLECDPWAQIATPRKSGAKLKVDHALNERQWRAANEELEAMPGGEPRCRLRFALWLAYGTGLRLEELVRLTVHQLVRAPDGGWELCFTGKGGKERQVPVAPHLFEILGDYMEARGHGRNPAAWPKTLPLLTSLQDQQVQKVRDLPLSPRTLHELLKRHFDAAAERLDDLLDQEALRRASAHWLRHTFSTELIARGVPVPVVQDLLGHADSATTALYTHADRKQRKAAIAKLMAGADRHDREILTFPNSV